MSASFHTERPKKKEEEGGSAAFSFSLFSLHCVCKITTASVKSEHSVWGNLSGCYLFIPVPRMNEKNNLVQKKHPKSHLKRVRVR